MERFLSEEAVVTPFDLPSTSPTGKSARTPYPSKNTTKGVRVPVKKKRPAKPTENSKFDPLPDLPKNPNVSGSFIFKYWKGLSEEDQGRLTLYVYRGWPIIDRKKVGGPDAATNIGKHHSPISEDDFQRIYGSGDYKLLLNEQYLYKKPVLQDGQYRFRSDDYPPILNLEELDMADPANGSYIERLKLKGVKLPGEDEDDSMALAQQQQNNQAVEALTGTVDKLVNRLTDRDSRPQIVATPLPESTRNVAEKHVVEMMNDGFKTALGAVKEGIGSQQKASDPMEIVNAVVNIAKEMAPKQDGSQAVLMKEILETNRQLAAENTNQNNRRIETLEAELRASRRQAEAAPVIPPAPPKTLIEQLRELKDLKSTMEDFTGGGSDEEPSGKRGSGSWMDHLPTIAPLALGFLNIAANFMHNYAVANGKPGTPQAPPPPMPMGPEQAMMPAIQQPQQHQQDPMLNPMQALYAQYHPMLEELRPPMMECFNDAGSDYPGAELAERVIGFKGRVFYDQLVSAGPDQLFNLLQSYPPIWNDMGKFPERVTKFISDFMAYDAIMAAQDKEPEVAEPLPVRKVKIPPAS